MSHFDVVIIGAGLAGLSCALDLAKRNVSVLLADRKRSLDRPVHTTGIFVRRTLEDFDIASRFLGPPVRHVMLHSPGGRRQLLESPRTEFRIGRMGKLYESTLDRACDEGVEVLLGAHFAGLERDRKGGVIVQIDLDGRRERCRTRYLVGADGASSRVARALGLGTNREWIVGAEEIVEGVPLDGPPTLHCYLDPILAPGYIGWVAHDGEQVHLGVGGYPDRFSPGESLAILRRRVAGDLDLSRATVVERRGGRIPVEGLVTRLSCRDGLLIGDAAGAVSPLTAGGLDGAMRLSRFAAEVLGTAIAQDEPRVLDHYPGRGIETRFISRSFMRRLLSSVRSPLLVELACAALRTTPGSAMAWQVFFGRGSFPEPDRSPLLDTASGL